MSATGPVREVWKPGDQVRIRADAAVNETERAIFWVVRGTLPDGGVVLVERDQPGYEWVVSPFDLEEAGPAQAQGGVA